MLLGTPDTLLLPEPLNHCLHRDSAPQVQSQPKLQVRAVGIAAQLGTCPTPQWGYLNCKYFGVKMKAESRRAGEDK